MMDSGPSKPASLKRRFDLRPGAVTVAGLVLCFPCFVCAQQASPSAGSGAQPNSQTPATFSTNAELVTVPVSVRGHDGKPLEGLQKTDFTVLDNGKPRSIAVLPPGAAWRAAGGPRPLASRSPAQRG